MDSQVTTNNNLNNSQEAPVNQEVVSQETQVKDNKVEVEAEKPADNPLSENFAKLMKQEKHNAELRKQLEAERKKIEQEKRDLEAFKAASLKAMEQNNPNVAVPNDVKEAMSAIKQLQEEIRKRDEKLQEEKYKAEERKLDAQIAKVVKDNDYDIIDKLEAQKQVKLKIAEEFEKSGKIITLKEACEAVANELADKFNKVKDSKFLKPKEAVKEAPNTKTSIVNKVGQIPSPSKALTEEDRMAAAIAHLKASKK